ncbi:serine hydrolase domain-containing protein [Ningiella sp. W23]|uniref:serine hydrolase domain-containing protein n=1 Tax=Ningiella sp. W23 TaxID=3023715 RepID=UPI003757AA73
MRIHLLAVLVFVATACSAAPPNSVSHPESSAVKQGFSKERLSRINSVMQAYVDQKKLAGTVTLVARNNEIVHQSAIGLRDIDSKLAMTTDSIFRIYSMTKPVTAVAALTLWEQGKFHMNDPIEKYLPELSGLKVYVSGSGDDMVLEDANRPIRIIDLFMHTAGFSYGFTDSEVDKLYRASQAGLLGSDAERSTVLKEIAKLPLNHQPGTKWHYGVNTDIIGFLVEALTDKKLGEYMQEVIFDPLEMSDTGFYVKAESAARFAKLYTADESGITVEMANEPLGDFLNDPAVHNGGGGLTSTIGDFYKFTQMLLNGGQYKGKRVLGRKTVEYFRTNHMPDRLLPFADNSPGEGYGLAVSVTIDQNDLLFMGSTGDYGWGGAASTYFRIDPKENLILISMTQFMPYGYHGYMDDYRNLVYQALVD